MKDYTFFYDKISAPFRQSQKLLAVLKLANKSITSLMYALYPLLLVYLLLTDWSRAIMTLVLPGLGFILLSIFRKWFNQARPYETWAISPLIIKETSGQSFPSRHVFSASLIAVCFWQVSPWISLTLLVLSGILALARVIAGIHYPKDVLVGFLLGIIWGALLFFL
ncbi:phosphatase PAP2 family protein [Streptococcus loxodontisalivarius]|uniref:Membrane-associated phospholipid phosphatase n=1 Tax=Streptococcus loxodontisalivarius TaxID=1349415 RepID=A0ABS2PRN4_9STRE|nr:phosphatase PAP2 family protein [Streptococcus loxodontisalivarius]MBM7642703.1 membrane-associated phospholipid phosphatase [Streptococcus loxodontisalivarius]